MGSFALGRHPEVDEATTLAVPAEEDPDSVREATAALSLAQATPSEGALSLAHTEGALSLKR